MRHTLLAAELRRRAGLVDALAFVLAAIAIARVGDGRVAAAATGALGFEDVQTCVGKVVLAERIGRIGAAGAPDFKAACSEDQQSEKGEQAHGDSESRLAGVVLPVLPLRPSCPSPTKR